MPRAAAAQPTPVPPRPLSVAEVPTGAAEWEGRNMRWEVREFNGRDAMGERVFAVHPGQACTITVRVHAWWQYDPNAYCPGCIVQLYFGLADVFC